MFSSHFVIFETITGQPVALCPEFVSGVIQQPSGKSCAIHLPFAETAVAVVKGDLPTIVTRLQERKPYEPPGNGA